VDASLSMLLVALLNAATASLNCSDDSFMALMKSESAFCCCACE
jgi:hypothetical protein